MTQRRTEGRKGKDTPAPLPRRKGDPAERLRRASIIAARRNRVIEGRVRPVAWKDIADEMGLSEKHCQTILRDALSNGWIVDVDPTAAEEVDHVLYALRACYLELQETIDAAELDSQVRVSAIRAKFEVKLRELDVLIAAGRVPRQLTTLNIAADMQRIFALVIEVISEGKEPEQAIADLIRRSEPFLPAGIVDAEVIDP